MQCDEAALPCVEFRFGGLFLPHVLGHRDTQDMGLECLVTKSEVLAISEEEIDKAHSVTAFFSFSDFVPPAKPGRSL